MPTRERTSRFHRWLICSFCRGSPKFGVILVFWPAKSRQTRLLLTRWGTVARPRLKFPSQIRLTMMSLNRPRSLSRRSSQDFTSASLESKQWLIWSSPRSRALLNPLSALLATSIWNLRPPQTSVISKGKSTPSVWTYNLKKNPNQFSAPTTDAEPQSWTMRFTAVASNHT